MGRKKWETQPAVQKHITKVSDELRGGYNQRIYMVILDKGSLTIKRILDKVSLDKKEESSSIEMERRGSKIHIIEINLWSWVISNLVCTLTWGSFNKMTTGTALGLWPNTSGQILGMGIFFKLPCDFNVQPRLRSTVAMM